MASPATVRDLVAALEAYRELVRKRGVDYLTIRPEVLAALSEEEREHLQERLRNGPEEAKITPETKH